MIVRAVITVCPTPLMNSRRALAVVIGMEEVVEGAGADCDMMIDEFGGSPCSPKMLTCPPLTSSDIRGQQTRSKGESSCRVGDLFSRRLSSERATSRSATANNALDTDNTHEQS
jgi:hypothetical protein